MSSPRSDVDPATKCVDMWEKSPGHLRNMLNERHSLVSVGISFRPDGTYYCTQTFGIPNKGDAGGDRCNRISNKGHSSESADEAAPVSPAGRAKMIRCLQQCMPEM